MLQLFITLSLLLTTSLLLGAGGSIHLQIDPPLHIPFPESPERLSGEAPVISSATVWDRPVSEAI